MMMPDPTEPSSVPDSGRRARVKSGEQLGFVDRLRAKGLFPLPAGRFREHPGPTATPWLVVPAFSGDTGSRSASSRLPPGQARHFASVEVIDSAGTPVSAPVLGQTYILRCRIVNLGAAASYGGIAEFYLAQPSTLDRVAASPGTTIPAQGYAGYTVMQNSNVVVSSPNRWKPETDVELTNGVLVRVYDPFIDLSPGTFDASSDRHLGRRDLSDFSGTWDGGEHFPLPPPGPPGGSTPGVLVSFVRFVITQTGLDVTVDFFEVVSPGAGFAPTPQRTVKGRIADGHLLLKDIDPTGVGTPVTPVLFHQWDLTLIDGNSLHFEHRTRTNTPQPVDTLTVGDLGRI